MFKLFLLWWLCGFVLLILQLVSNYFNDGDYSVSLKDLVTMFFMSFFGPILFIFTDIKLGEKIMIIKGNQK